jgi:hypothetical protein
MGKLTNKIIISLKKEKVITSKMIKYNKVLEFTRKLKKNSRPRRKPKKK